MTNPLDIGSYAAIRTCLRLYNHRHGESQFEEVEFPFSELRSDGTAPVLATPFQEATRHGLRIVPPGWKRDWAPAARRMIAVYLSGKSDIEASDGGVRRLSPGIVLLAEDITGRGHRVTHVGMIR